MKKLNGFVLLAATALALSSCGKGGIGNPFGKSDPLADQEEYIRNAKPGFSKPDPKGPSADNLIIQSSASIYRFEEGISTDYNLGYRILADGYYGELFVLNLDEFPGAIFDSVKGVFSWTPNADFITTDTPYVELLLRVELRVSSVQGPEVVSRKTRDIQVIVHRREVRPTIVSDSMSPEQIFRAGSSDTFDLVVDYKGLAGQQNTPDLKFETASINTRNDISMFVRPEGTPVQDANIPNRWTYKFRVNLEKIELPSIWIAAGFQIKAVTNQSEVSLPREFSVKVYSNFEKAETSCYNCTWVVKAGVTTTGEFFVFDTKQRGKILTELNGSAPPGLTLACGSESRTWIQKCNWSFTPPLTARGRTFYVYLRSRNLSTIMNDTYENARNIQINYSVEN